MHYNITFIIKIIFYSISGYYILTPQTEHSRNSTQVSQQGSHTPKGFSFNLYVDELPHIPVTKEWKLYEEGVVKGKVNNPAAECASEPME